MLGPRGVNGRAGMTARSADMIQIDDPVHRPANGRITFIMPQGNRYADGRLAYDPSFVRFQPLAAIVLVITGNRNG